MEAATTASSHRRLTAAVLALTACLALAACEASETPLPVARGAGAFPAPTLAAHGFVVWESNRSGDWRLWISDLRGGNATQLTADERGRDHCCAHIAPDGSQIAYLSLPAGRGRYLDQDAVGQLRLVSPDGRSTRKLADGARTYFEHRAAVWSGSDELSYIAEDTSVVRLDVTTGASTRILEAAGEARRWLAGPGGDWAATGQGALAPIEAGRRGTDIPLPGCQPYFSQDGRWGFWTAGAGGPIDRYELATGETTTLLGKNDPRLPTGRGYLYFPMLSADRTLLAFAASDGEHDHFRADYDLFVTEVDAETLQPMGKPWPVAPHPAVDRFPDVWREPLVLGRLVGTGSVRAVLDSPDGESREWRLAGMTLKGERMIHTVSRPGVYEVLALSAGGSEHGVVIVEEQAPHLEPRTTWPATTAGLLWQWAARQGSSTTPLQQEGGTPNPKAALDLSLGPVLAVDTADRLHQGLQRTNQLTLELVLTPPAAKDDELGAVVAIGRDSGRENLVLGQRGGRWVLRMRVGPKGAEAYAEADLGPLTPGRRTHLAIAYSPGRAAVFQDGQEVYRTKDLRGHFFQWKPYSLTLGDRARGGAAWHGRIEALAIYDRPLNASEVEAAAALAL